MLTAAVFVMALVLLLATGVELTGDGHGSGPGLSALHTIEFPDSVRINQTESIRYALSWYHPNGTATYPDAEDPFMEEVFYRIMFFVPDEFAVLNDDKSFVTRIADAYTPHTGTYYQIDVPYSANGTAGSVDIRLDRPFYHDRDVIVFHGYALQTQRTGDGAVLVGYDSLTDEYDIRQSELLFGYNQEDPLQRYSYVYKDEDAVHMPDDRTARQTADAGQGEDIYLEERMWPDYADFLRWAIKGGGSASDYLVRPDFTQEFIDDFVWAYPEFGTGSSASSDDSAATFTHESPYKQFSAGVPLQEIRCSDGMVLMGSQDGMPVCVRESSVAMLEGKGFVRVVAEFNTPDYNATKNIDLMRNRLDQKISDAQ